MRAQAALVCLAARPCLSCSGDLANRDEPLKKLAGERKARFVRLDVAQSGLSGLDGGVSNIHG